MKATIIFLHGGPGFKDYLKPFFTELNDRFDCIFYDQARGPKVVLEDLLSQLDEIVCSLSGKIILLGHSWGGVLAIEYAARNQAKLSGLVLMSTCLCYTHWKDEFNKEKLNLGLVNAGVEKIFLAPDEVKEGKAFLDSTWRTFSEETFASLNKSYIGKFDVTPLLKGLKIPVLNIFGEKDVRCPARVAKTFRLFKEDMIDFQIPDAGHFPFLQNSGRLQIYKILTENCDKNLMGVEMV